MPKIPGIHQMGELIIGTPVGAQITTTTGVVPGGPTVTVIPKSTSKWRISIDTSIYTGSGQNFCNIVATVGSPVWLNQPIQDKQSPTGFAPMHMTAEVLLTAGITYTFACYTDSGSGFMYFGSGPSGIGASMIAQQIL